MNRFPTRLSWMAMVGLVAVLFGFASAAQASGTSWAWTESKARQMVARKALVKVPAPLRASLASELLAGVRLYSGLEMAAMEVGDVDALATYQHLGVRYRSALETLRNGLQIQSAACTGLGVAVSGNRFGRFRCPVTSMPLEIPTVELDFGGPGAPASGRGPAACRRAVPGSPRHPCHRKVGDHVPAAPLVRPRQIAAHRRQLESRR